MRHLRLLQRLLLLRQYQLLMLHLLLH
jgi:hypothetical protein